HRQRRRRVRAPRRGRGRGFFPARLTLDPRPPDPRGFDGFDRPAFPGLLPALAFGGAPGGGGLAAPTAPVGVGGVTDGFQPGTTTLGVRGTSDGGCAAGRSVRGRRVSSR